MSPIKDPSEAPSRPSGSILKEPKSVVFSSAETVHEKKSSPRLRDSGSENVNENSRDDPMEGDDENQGLASVFAEKERVHFHRGLSESIWITKKKGRTIRSGSIYVKSRRFSRYGALGNFFKPYLTTTKPLKDTIPIDSVGLLNNISFSWINKYKINAEKLKALSMQKILSTGGDSADSEASSQVKALQLPLPASKEKTALNQKRLLAKYGNEDRMDEVKDRSMFHVLWAFCKTRYLITFFPHVILLAVLLIFPLMLKFTSDSIFNEFQKVNNSKHYDILSNEDFMLTQKLFLNTLGENGRADMQNRSAEGINLLSTYLQTLDYFTEYHRNQTWNPELQNRPELTMKYFQHLYKKQEQQILHAKARHTYVALMVILFVLYILARNMINFLNLRTAIRFRSGCVGSLYKRAMKSLVTYRISPTAILSIATDETNALMGLSTKGLASLFTLLKLLIVTIFYSTAIDDLNWTLGIGYAYVILFPAITILITRVGVFYLKKSRKYRSQKIALIEEFMCNFKTIVMYRYQRAVIDGFLESVRKEFDYMRRMLNFSVKFIPETISVLLFALVALEDPKPNKPNDNLILLIYIWTVQTLMTDLVDGIESIIKSESTLDKLKSVYQLKPTSVCRDLPTATAVLSIRNATFNWYRYMNDSWKYNKMDVLVTQKTNELRIKDFSLLKNQILGVTGSSGSGKTMLLYSILGHTNLLEGEMRQKGKFTFFPSTGYFNIDSLLENLLMNATYNKDCVEDALSIVGLEELFGDYDTLNERIGNLEMSPEQLDKLIMAQAIFCENDMILLDNPLSRCDSMSAEEILEVFKDVIDNLILQKKSIIMATQNQDFLQYCHHIYVLQNGEIAFEGTFKNLETDPLFRESMAESTIVQKYNSKVDFCGISPTEMHPFVREQDGECRSNRSIFLGLLLAIFIGTSSVAYYTLPVVRVFENTIANDSMLSLFVVVSIAGKLLTTMITTMFKGTGRAKAMLMDKIKLKKLLGTSMNYFYNSSLSEAIGKFAENNFFDSCNYADLIECLFGVLLTTVLSGFICPWLVIIYCSILVWVLVVYKFYKKTARHMHGKIRQSAMLLHKTVTSHIRGRICVQSTPNFDKYLKNCYEIIDCNSTAIFMYKAMVYHVQFLVQIFFVFGFLTLCFTILLDNPNQHLETQRNFIYGIFLFFSFCGHVNRMISTAYQIQGDIVQHESHQQWLNNVTQRPLCDGIVTDLKPDPGYSVDIQGLIIKMKDRVNVCISNLHIDGGERIRIKGSGTQYLVPLWSRILTPKAGLVFFGETDMLAYTEETYSQLIGFIPLDIQAYSKTIRAVLDPKQKLTDVALLDVVDRFNLLPGPNAQHKLGDSISILRQWEKQLLCLCRIILTCPKIIVVENPHPKALPYIETTLKSNFPSATVIFIGSNQFAMCSRTVELK